MNPREIQDAAMQSERLVTLFPRHVKPLIGENPGCEGHRQQRSRDCRCQHTCASPKYRSAVKSSI
jgi:hypothetical protein